MTKDLDTDKIEGFQKYKDVSAKDNYARLIDRANQLLSSKSASFEQYRLLKSQENIKRIIADPKSREKTINTAVNELISYIEEVNDLESSVFLNQEAIDTLKVY